MASTRVSSEAAAPLLSEGRQADERLGPLGRVFIFVIFTQVVQALMSYDGGATQFSTSSLARSGWSPFLLGLLGAMDKFGQVATAFIWGDVLMKYNTKLLLTVGLFWKATCCLLFGRLQKMTVEPITQLYMLFAKLGMGVTEALVSVWATVWVQRNAPQDARARWLGFAGTSAGIGSGVGSGVASLWSPVGAFVLQAMVLFVIWGVLLLTPAWMFSFDGPTESSPEEDSQEAGNMLNCPDPGRMLAQEVACRSLSGPQSFRPDVITFESVRSPGYYLDTSVDPQDDGFKVRASKGDPEEPWAQFYMRHLSSRGGGDVVSLESVRLPGHYLEASGETTCMPQARFKVQIMETDGTTSSTHFRLHRVGNIVSIESVLLPGYFVGATGESMSMLGGISRSRVSVSKADPQDNRGAQFVLHQVNGASTASDPACSPSSRRKSASAWEALPMVLRNRLWLWTAMAISLSCFVTSGISFLWQNTISSVWGFNNAWSYGLFLFSTGLGGLLGVAVGPNIFDRHLGGFHTVRGKALCLLWCKRMMFAAALCSTVCTLMLAEKACHLVAYNVQAAVYWQLAFLVANVFSIFVLINSITGTLYGINTDAVMPEMRTFAAGLTVSFQNVFGYAFGPLLPSAATELFGRLVPREWPSVNWDQQVMDGAKFAVGMGVALAAAWALFAYTRLAAVSARLLSISSRRCVDLAA